MKEFRISVPAWVTLVVRAENETEARELARQAADEEITVSMGGSDDSNHDWDESKVTISPVGTINEDLNFDMAIDDETEIG